MQTTMAAEKAILDVLFEDISELVSWLSWQRQALEHLLCGFGSRNFRNFLLTLF